MVSLPPKDEGKKWVLGQFAHKGKIIGDVGAPFDEPWGDGSPLAD